MQQTSSSTLNSGSLRSILFLWFCNDDDDGDNDDNDGDDDDPSCYIIFVIDYVHDRLGMSQHSRVDILCLIIIL